MEKLSNISHMIMKISVDDDQKYNEIFTFNQTVKDVFINFINSYNVEELILDIRNKTEKTLYISIQNLIDLLENTKAKEFELNIMRLRPSNEINHIVKSFSVINQIFN